MTEAEKMFWLATKANGEREIVWNWSHNMNRDTYPEYRSFEGPFQTREQAESRLTQ